MRKIIVVGGGFAGISALRHLRPLSKENEIVLIDKKSTFDFLPNLPDMISQRIRSRYLTYPLSKIARRCGAKFIQDEVVHVYHKNYMLETSARTISYDCLILASGTQTNFYGMLPLKRFAYTLDSVEDAVKLQKMLKESAEGASAFVIGGGGYTGVEIATHLRKYFEKRRLEKRIIIVEKVPSILGALPGWMRQYVEENLARMRIEVKTDMSVSDIYEDKIELSNGECLKPAVLIWTAGVRTPEFFKELGASQNPQGRIMVNKYLKFREGCFVAGDAGCYYQREIPLRMAVKFAIMQGKVAAKNVFREIQGLPLMPFKPVDLGFIVPMANHRSCGRVLQANCKGFLPTVFYYLFCLFRSWGVFNRLGMLINLLCGGYRNKS